MKKYCESLTVYLRRPTHEVRVGSTRIGGDNPVRLQSMTNTDTNDTDASVSQVLRIADAGGELVRLTAQGRKEAANLEHIHRGVRNAECKVPLVADIHFLPAAALVAAEYVDKVRINPGNFHDQDGSFERLIDICKRRGVALRIGVNHGSLSPAIMDRYGDTPEGMVASAMEYLEKCRALDFDQVVVSMKSSNVRVMVQAYRMLAAAMHEARMTFPLHLGVTEAGDDMEGRVKSAVGIGALLVDGIGDTIRVSLTEAPEREIPVARMLADHFNEKTEFESLSLPDAAEIENHYNPYPYSRRTSRPIAGIGGSHPPVIGSELTAEQRALLWESDLATVDQIPSDRIVVLTTRQINGTAEQRAFFLQMSALGKDNPVIIKRTYHEKLFEALQIKAAADTGLLFLDGFGDGLWIENIYPEPADSEQILPQQIDSLSLAILQATRVRISKADFIACPSCGRTLYNIERTLAEIKARTAHLAGVKIGIMGCIVNGPGEMADADYGYVGSGAGRITLYKGREVVKRNVPETEAINELIALIEAGGDWVEPSGGV